MMKKYLKIRFKEHQRDSQMSGLSQYLKATNHNVSDAKLLHKTDNKERYTRMPVH